MDWSILDFSKIPDEIPQNIFENKVDEYELVFVIENRYLLQENHTDIHKSTKHKKKKSSFGKEIFSCWEFELHIEKDVN